MNSADTNTTAQSFAVSKNVVGGDVGATDPHTVERAAIGVEMAVTLGSDDCVVLSERAAQIGAINLQRA